MLRLSSRERNNAATLDTTIKIVVNVEGEGLRAILRRFLPWHKTILCDLNKPHHTMNPGYIYRGEG